MKRFLISSVIILALVIQVLSSRGDNLYLRGILKEVQDDYVVVDVISTMCKGERKFKLSPGIEKSLLQKNKPIYFAIDTVTCNTEKTITILEVQQ